MKARVAVPNWYFSRGAVVELLDLGTMLGNVRVRSEDGEEVYVAPGSLEPLDDDAAEMIAASRSACVFFREV